QASWLEVQMCAAGTIASGWSMLPTVTSTEPGRAVSRKVSAVPQAAHSWRTARGVARSSAGVPAVKAKVAAGNVAQVTNGAPGVQQARAEAAPARRGLDVQLLEPSGSAGVLERPHERQRGHADGSSPLDRDQDPPPLGMTKDPMDGAGEFRLRGRHVVLAELRDEERRHRFELGLGGETHVYGAFRHGSLDA